MSNVSESEITPTPVSDDKGKSVCTPESFSKTNKLEQLNTVYEDVKTIQNKIEEFSGISEDDPVFFKVENFLYENLIALNNIPTSIKEEVNQKKHEVILLIQRQLKELNLKLQDNQAEQKGVNLALSTKNCNSKKDSPITTLVETPKKQKVIEEMEECPFISSSLIPTLENKEFIQTCEESKLDEIALKLLGHSIKESSLTNLRSSAHNVPFNPETRPIRLKTVPAPDSAVCIKKRDNNKKNANKRTINRSLIKCILPENVFKGLFQTLKGFGNVVLGFVFPPVEIGNRLALKRIQVILLHIRFLLTFLMLEIPLMTAVVFYGLCMPDMNQIE